METEKNDRQIEIYKSALENLGMKGAQNAAHLSLINIFLSNDIFFNRKSDKRF